VGKENTLPQFYQYETTMTISRNPVLPQVGKLVIFAA